mmetsp:Transcript_8610/g.19350  ORF Transcript_8610/g.19350 Transcript_8610/m.19350 type:complete len:220 (+) Transcript_8610:535-1194(+)
MVGHNGNKSVEVGQQISKEKVLDSRDVHIMSSSHVFAKSQERQWEEKEMDEKVGSSDNRHEFPEGVERSASAEQQCTDSDCITCDNSFRNLLACLSPPGKFQLFVCVWCVIKPLPGAHKNWQGQIFDKDGHWHVSHVLQIVLHKIGIFKFRQTVVMTVVVLDIPRLWHHPIEPIAHAVPQTTNGELEPIPPILVRVDLVISAMARVVCDHGPASEGKCR